MIVMNCDNLYYCESCKEYECGLCLSGDDDFKIRCEDNDNCLIKRVINNPDKVLEICELKK